MGEKNLKPLFWEVSGDFFTDLQENVSYFLKLKSRTTKRKEIGIRIKIKI